MLLRKIKFVFGSTFLSLICSVCVQMEKEACMQTGMEVAAEAKEAGVPSVTLVQSAPYLADSEKRGKVPLGRLRDKLGASPTTLYTLLLSASLVTPR
jgi:hypothetical protein